MIVFSIFFFFFFNDTATTEIYTTTDTLSLHDALPFSHHVADLRGYLPLVRRLSLWVGATICASGGEPPPHYQFFLGGANTYYLFPDRDIAFVGLRTQQRRGRHVQKAELGAQWELAPDVFA